VVFNLPRRFSAHENSAYSYFDGGRQAKSSRERLKGPSTFLAEEEVPFASPRHPDPVQLHVQQSDEASFGQLQLVAGPIDDDRPPI
jgi:hypothetical protein